MNDTSNKTVFDSINKNSLNTENSEIVDDDQTRMDVSINYPDITDLTIHEIIGKGGSGIVYKGRQHFLERDVAIKVLIINQDDQAFYKRFQREAQILAKLSHPNIVSCYQAGMTNATHSLRSSPYIAMEFINGPSLSDWIEKQGKLSNTLSLNIIIDIAKALSYALKQDIIHRDIKAENILLSPLESHQAVKNESQAFHFIPKLADLGIARTCQSKRSDDLTQVGYMIGTPTSMAPEQFNQPDKVDFKADIYGLGCVLFHMLTGKKPFQGKTLTELIISKNSDREMTPSVLENRLDPDLDKLVTSMLAKDKEKRPASYEALIKQCHMISNKLQHDNPRKSWQWIQPPKSVLFLVFIIITGIITAFLIKSEWPLTTQQSSDQLVSEIRENEVITEHEPDVLDTATRPGYDTNPLALENNQSDLQKNGSLSTSTINFTLSYMDKTQNFLSPGELYNILIRPEKDAYIYCYYMDHNGSIIRFFPNRFNDYAFVSAKNAMILPGDMPFDLNASNDGITEFITCFAFEENISQNIPDDIWGVDFEPLALTSFQKIRNTFLNNGYKLFNEQTLKIKVR